MNNLQTEPAAAPEGFREMNLADHPWWALALDHLEEQWPGKLERLLKQGKLKEHLDKLVETSLNQYLDLQESGLDEVDAASQLNPQLEPPNPKYDPDNPKELSPEGNRMLREFRLRYL